MKERIPSQNCLSWNYDLKSFLFGFYSILNGPDLCVCPTGVCKYPNPFGGLEPNGSFGLGLSAER